MPAGADWIPLNEAAELLSAARDTQEARIELVDAMHEGRLTARAALWTEEGAPTAIGRPLPIRLSDGTTQIPADFWLRGHAFEQTHYIPVSYSTTEADWRLLRFRMSYLVDGGRPGWCDRWGLNIIDHGLKTWTWNRVAIGVTVDAAFVRSLLDAYSVGIGRRELRTPTCDAPPLRSGWAIADEPLIERALAMIAAGTARSPNDAARQLAHEAQGHGSIDSTTDRLGRRIRTRLRQIGDGSPSHSGPPKDSSPEHPE